MDNVILASFADELEKFSLYPKALLGSKWLGTEGEREISAKALIGRLRRGKGLVGTEKEHVARLAGLSPGELETALERIPKAKFLATHPLSRLLSKLTPISRRIYAEGYSRRANEPSAPFSGREQELLDIIKNPKGGLPAAWKAATRGKSLEELFAASQKSGKPPGKPPEKKPRKALPAET